MTRMEDCEQCRGRGYIRLICTIGTCPTCHGACEVEVWDDTPEPDTVPADHTDTNQEQP